MCRKTPFIGSETWLGNPARKDCCLEGLKTVVDRDKAWKYHPKLFEHSNSFLSNINRDNEQQWRSKFCPRVVLVCIGFDEFCVQLNSAMDVFKLR
ncbi:hypothetical protein AVEN_18736-1 [Araneus ventricosus]|uniref:Uncharacterized protein n=1 Tax=Araneus ventricosus TaxID=182803 RepID=A0A4Y2GJG3_ARAVE|nr:hypothetical protein AVEN_18736-1 [Araneus ventricosus]